MTSPHPAPFSQPIMDVLKDLIADWPGPILDPYAGCGRVHELGRDDTWGVEIEREWAESSPLTIWSDSSSLTVLDHHEHLASVRHLGVDYERWISFPRPRAIVTSPDYGNRMADAYLGTPEELSERAASGKPPRRKGYAISLGRALSPGSTSREHFGPGYISAHTKVMTAVTGVCLPDAMAAVNVSDFFKAKKRVLVVSFWVQLLRTLGWNIIDMIPVGTRRYRDGTNSELRVDAEQIIVATLKEGP